MVCCRFVLLHRGVARGDAELVASAGRGVGRGDGLHPLHRRRCSDRHHPAVSVLSQNRVRSRNLPCRPHLTTSCSLTPTSLRPTRKTAKSRRKQAVKKAAGRKGTIYEETYLLNSIKKAAEAKLAEIQAEAGALLPCLLSLRGAAMRAAAVGLQARVGQLEVWLGGRVEEVWAGREGEWAREEAERVERMERGEEVGPRVVWSEVEEGRRRVERPVVAKGKWRVGLLEKAD